MINIKSLKKIYSSLPSSGSRKAMESSIKDRHSGTRNKG